MSNMKDKKIEEMEMDTMADIEVDETEMGSEDFEENLKAVLREREYEEDYNEVDSEEYEEEYEEEFREPTFREKMFSRLMTVRNLLIKRPLLFYAAGVIDTLAVLAVLKWVGVL